MSSAKPVPLRKSNSDRPKCRLTHSSSESCTPSFPTTGQAQRPIGTAAVIPHGHIDATKVGQVTTQRPLIEIEGLDRLFRRDAASLGHTAQQAHHLL